MSKTISPIWDYFKVAEDSKYAICNSCGESISRGGKSTKTFNTTNLVYHMKSRPDIARVYMIQVYLHGNAGLKYIHVHTRTESSR